MLAQKNRPIEYFVFNCLLPAPKRVFLHFYY
jgi:hypothetical protein